MKKKICKGLKLHEAVYRNSPSLAMTGYHLTNLNNCKLLWKEGLCIIVATLALTSVSLSAQTVIVLLAYV